MFYNKMGKKYIHKYDKRSKRIYDGTDRFKIKSTKSIYNDLLEQLNDLNKNSKLKYYYEIDFTKEKEYKELILEKDLDKIKNKLDNYIDMITNSILYPSEYLKNFKNRYLTELLKIRDNMNEILILKPFIEKPPSLIRQESYEEIESKDYPKARRYVHRLDKRKS